MESKKIVRNVFIVFIICSLIFIFFNANFNGIFKEWLYKTFLFYTKGNSIPNWNLIKKTLIIFLLIIIPLLYLFLQLYIKYKQKQTKETTRKEIVALLSTSEKEKKNEYPEIVALLNKIEIEKKYQEELFEKETKRKNDLITYLAHDLKTPLASVIGYLSLLEEAQDLPPKQKQKFAKIALEKSYRLEELIEQFFDITRFNLQNIVIQKEKIDVELLLEQLKEEFYPIIEKQNKKISLCIKNREYIYADPDKFGRVLTNVLKNAIAYSYENTIISITEYIEDNKMYIQIKNQGNQIPEQKLKIIFESFYRLDQARSTNKGGAGLGLAIAKEIMKAHDGLIKASSSKKETCFTIILPIK